MQTLSPRVILVTGAYGSVGTELVRALAKAGDQLILLGRHPKKLERLCQSLQGSYVHEPSLLPMDLANADANAYETALQLITKHHGRLDGLVHLAAKHPGLKPLHLTPMHEWMETIQVNFNAAFLLTQVLFPLLRCSTTSKVIFTLALPKQPQPYQSAYGVSKQAIKALVDQWSCDEDNTIFLSYTPPYVKSKIYHAVYPGEATPLTSAHLVAEHYVKMLAEDFDATERHFEPHHFPT